MILRYPGSKERAARDLLSLAPLSYREYREPFCGNASMLWFVPTTKARWINDLDRDVHRFMLFLKSGRVEGLKRLRARMIGRDMDAYKREFGLAKLRWVVNDDAVAYWFLRRLAYGQLVDRKRNDIASFGYCYTRNGVQACTPDRIDHAHRIMQEVRVTHSDYSILLDTPGDEVWCLVDPPYVVSDHARPLYPHDFTLRQHEELAERLKVCKHRFLLTIGFCGLIQDLYCRPCFNWSFRRYKYQARNKARRPIVEELVVTNY